MGKEVVVRHSVSEEEFINCYWLLYTTSRARITENRLPDFGKLCITLGALPSVVKGLLENEAVRRKLVLRGVPLSNDYSLSERQYLCLAKLTDPTFSGGLRARLGSIGVSGTEFKTWCKNPMFKKALDNLAADILDDSVAGAYLGLAQAAERGDVNAIKYLLEVTGRWDPNAKTTMDVMGVLSGVVEIIQKYVTDPEVLRSIAGDLSMLSAKAGLNARGGEEI